MKRRKSKNKAAEIKNKNTLHEYRHLTDRMQGLLVVHCFWAIHRAQMLKKSDPKPISPIFGGVIIEFHNQRNIADTFQNLPDPDISAPDGDRIPERPVQDLLSDVVRILRFQSFIIYCHF